MPVPNNMTNIFKLMGLTVNRYCKAFIRKNTQDWYFNKNRKEMENGTQAHENKEDVRISVLKPLHTSWVTTF